MQQVSLIYQFWIHTEMVDRLPRPLEFLLNTPSHHRVHHGTDLEYLDKNHGGILIIWDRIFGTFQPETHRPTYGLTKNIGSFNPFVVAFKTWGELLSSVRTAPGLKAGLLYLVKPPGWRHDGKGGTVSEIRKRPAAITNSEELSLTPEVKRG
jgi:hypothetical protein